MNRQLYCNLLYHALMVHSKNNNNKKHYTKQNLLCVYSWDIFFIPPTQQALCPILNQLLDLHCTTSNAPLPILMLNLLQYAVSHMTIRCTHVESSQRVRQVVWKEWLHNMVNTDSSWEHREQDVTHHKTHSSLNKAGIVTYTQESVNSKGSFINALPIPNIQATFTVYTHSPMPPHHTVPTCTRHVSQPHKGSLLNCPPTHTHTHPHPHTHTHTHTPTHTHQSLQADGT